VAGEGLMVLTAQRVFARQSNRGAVLWHERCLVRKPPADGSVARRQTAVSHVLTGRDFVDSRQSGVCQLRSVSILQVAIREAHGRKQSDRTMPARDDLAT
jgi:hypothetical protein